MRIDHDNGFSLVPESTIDRMILRELIRRGGLPESLNVLDGPDESGVFAATLPSRDGGEAVDLLDYEFTPVALRLAIFAGTFSPEFGGLDLDTASITIEAMPKDERGVFARQWVSPSTLASSIESGV